MTLSRLGPGPQDGLRVRHVAARPDHLRQEGRADLPGPRDQPASRLQRRHGAKIDAEVRRFVDEGYQSAVNILSGNRDKLERIAMALLEREVLDANEMQMIIENKELPARVNPNAASAAKGRSPAGAEAGSRPVPAEHRSGRASGAGVEAVVSFQLSVLSKSKLGGPKGPPGVFPALELNAFDSPFGSPATKSADVCC